MNKEEEYGKLLAEQQREIRALKKHIKILEEDWYSPKEYENLLDKGLKQKDIAIKEAKKEVFDDIERNMGSDKACTSWECHCPEEFIDKDKIDELKRKHLNTQDTEEKNGNQNNKGRS